MEKNEEAAKLTNYLHFLVSVDFREYLVLKSITILNYCHLASNISNVLIGSFIKIIKYHF